MPRALLIFALVVLAGGAPPPADAAEDPFPEAAAGYLVRKQGKTVWEKAARRRLPPASLTKIMTGLLVLERYRPAATVTVSRTAAKETGSRLGLRVGDRMRVADLLAATLVRSANDACRALAEWMAGSERRFVALMNRRARVLGLRDTHFANACGHDAPDHYSSARDLAMLAEAALRSARFAGIVGMAEAELRTVDGRQTFTIANTNALIGRLDGAIGVKTGYTRRAGPCLVALVERNGLRVLIVLLNAPNRWEDVHRMIERAFSGKPPNV